MSARIRTSDLTVPARFRGPAASGNGGYTAGALAERIPGDTSTSVVEVRLRQPPPLDVPMKVRYDEGGDGSEAAVLLMGGATIAVARLVDADLDTVDQVSTSEASDAMAQYPGLRSHPFPSCFACGTERAEGDGLRIFPGPVGAGGLASTWVPHESLAEFSDLHDNLSRVGRSTTWAALDCIGGWAGDIGERKMVLGTMTAQLDALPLVNEPHVVVGALHGSEGRKTFTASTLYDSDERIVGRAQHIWIAIDPSAFT